MHEVHTQFCLQYLHGDCISLFVALHAYAYFFYITVVYTLTSTHCLHLTMMWYRLTLRQCPELSVSSFLSNTKHIEVNGKGLVRTVSLSVGGLTTTVLIHH